VDDIEFARNDSSWCASNMVDELVSLGDKCLCSQTRCLYVREATGEDEEQLGIVGKQELEKNENSRRD